MRQQRCPVCREPLVDSEPGDSCSKCGAVIVARAAHSADDDGEDNVIDGERVAVPSERY
jgi:hypothetical protein